MDLHMQLSYSCTLPRAASVWSSNAITVTLSISTSIAYVLESEQGPAPQSAASDAPLNNEIGARLRPRGAIAGGNS